ncbi:MAG TPA: cytochrome c peroxidase [Burkholderiaceae bacterium]
MAKSSKIYLSLLLEGRCAMIWLACSLLLSGCGGGGSAGGNSAAISNNNTQLPPSDFLPDPGLSPMAALGEIIFFDTGLSPGKQACATCHVPALGLSQEAQFIVPFGGVKSNVFGFRNAPSGKYTMYSPPFSISGTAQGAGQPAVNGMPVGGLFLDGRVDTLAQQAVKPFLSSFEMANPDSATVTAELAGRPYIKQFTDVFGANVLNNPNATLAAIGQALAQLETEFVSFHPFNSKYDAFVRGQIQLTQSEANGLAVFNNPAKGNCASCHTSDSVGGVPALFTDHTYRAIGVPRNRNIPFNQDAVFTLSAGTYAYVPQNGIGLGAPGHRYYDLGLCGPLRTDLSADKAYCGMFKVPTLRNVAVKERYFHNGLYTSLCDVVNFHLTRESAPAHWYVKPDGTTPDQIYNDMPLAYAGNINTSLAPFGKTVAPRLNNAEINDVIAFLTTLTDKFDPTSTQVTTPAQCTSVTH